LQDIGAGVDHYDQLTCADHFIGTGDDGVQVGNRPAPIDGYADLAVMPTSPRRLPAAQGALGS
jgi:hypothetical protein